MLQRDRVSTAALAGFCLLLVCASVRAQVAEPAQPPQPPGASPSGARAPAPDAGAARLETLHAGLSATSVPTDATSPRAAIETFLRLWRHSQYSEAAHLLDLSWLEEPRQAEEGPRLARRLGLLLEIWEPGGFGRLSEDPLGAPEEGVSPEEEIVTRAAPGEKPLRMSRHPSAQAGYAWVFSRDTTSGVDTLYEQSGLGWAGDHLPPVLFEWRVGGVRLWQWIGSGLALILSLVLAVVLGLLGRRLFAKFASLTPWSWDDQIVELLRGPLVALFWAPLFLALLPALAVTAEAHAPARLFAKIVVLVAAGWLATRLVDVAADSLSHLFKGRHDDLATSMVPVFRRILKPLVAVIAGIFALQNAGMNVGGLLAGLGIGGLAVALAGKPTLENIFGSIAIAFDRPFKVGDFIRLGEFLGNVEDVGLRSTRIRTLDRTLVTIPNSQMADAKVENFAARDRMRLLANIGVQYDTTLDQLRLVVDEIKRYLLAHPQVWQESFSVRFVGFGASSLNIEVICYVTTPDFGIFTGIREAILMDLAAILERAGVQLAFPSQTLYFAREPNADDPRVREARELVARRRAAGELCLPEIPEAVRTGPRAPREP